MRRGLAIACAVQLATPVARAQEPVAAVPVEPDKTPEEAAAIEAFREGTRQYNARQYREAAQAFERSLEAAWSIEAAYNMALSLDRSGDAIAAYRAYRRYLEVAADDDVHRSTALERGDQLREQLAEVLLQLDSPEAIREIRINGAPVDKDAFPWLTLPGPLEVEFIGEAGQVKDVRAEVRPGGTVTIVFPGFIPNEPPPVVRTPPPVVDKPKPDPRRQRVVRAAYAMGGLTLASGVVLAGLGGRTLMYRNWYATECPCEPQEAERKREGGEKFDDFQLATNVAVGVTVALGITAAALIVAAVRNRKQTATTRARFRWLGSGVELGF